MEPLKEIRPYGLWPSPITAKLLSGRLHLEDVQWDSDGQSLLWLEGRSDRSVLICSRMQEAPRDLTEEHSLKGGVGYGGGGSQFPRDWLFLLREMVVFTGVL
jgi:hypothetical protein